MLRRRTAVAPSLVFVVVSLLVVSAIGYAEFAGSSNPPSQPTGSGRTGTTTMAKILTTVNVGGEIAIQPLVLPSSVASNETIQYSFSVTSSVSGPWEFAVIQKGTQVFVPPNISSQWPPLDYPLPSYLSIQFATENPTGSTFSTTVVLNVTTMGAPKGTSSLELVAFQQQTGIPGVPGVLAETSYPFNLIVD